MFFLESFFPQRSDVPPRLNLRAKIFFRSPLIHIAAAPLLITCYSARCSSIHHPKTPIDVHSSPTASGARASRRHTPLMRARASSRLAITLPHPTSHLQNPLPPAPLSAVPLCVFVTRWNKPRPTNAPRNNGQPPHQLRFDDLTPAPSHPPLKLFNHRYTLRHARIPAPPVQPHRRRIPRIHRQRGHFKMPS